MNAAVATSPHGLCFRLSPPARVRGLWWCLGVRPGLGPSFFLTMNVGKASARTLLTVGSLTHGTHRTSSRHPIARKGPTARQVCFRAQCEQLAPGG